MTAYKNPRLEADCEACAGTGMVPTVGLHEPCEPCRGHGRVPVPTSDLPSVLASLVPGAESITVYQWFRIDQDGSRCPVGGLRLKPDPRGRFVCVRLPAVVFPEPEPESGENR